MATIFEEYAAKFAGSRALWERARKIIPSGVNHDVRYINPFPIYMDHAKGCRKWDIEQHEFIDLCTGHGSLILGHGHPAVLKAMHEAADKFTHPSAPTPYEVRWAELVTSMVPCAEMVRYQLSGTEATMLAMRIARAHTGRSVIVKLRDHFHGWHDYAMIEYVPPYDVPGSTGVPPAVASAMRTVPIRDLAAMEAALAPRDVAAVILEADGPAGGAVPVLPRLPPGPPRADHEVRHDPHLRRGDHRLPDGPRRGAGVLRRDPRTWPPTPRRSAGASRAAPWPAKPRSWGTSPSSPTTPSTTARSGSATRARSAPTRSPRPSGAAALELLKDGQVQDQAAKTADRLRTGFNAALREAGAGGCAYGTRSTVCLCLGDDLPKGLDPVEFSRTVEPARLLQRIKQPTLKAMQCAQMLEGIDFLGGSHGWTSGVMTEADTNEAVARWARALQRVIAEGYLKGK